MFLILLSGVGVLAFAEDVLPPTPEEWGKIIVDLTKGELGLLAVVGVVVQAVMLLLRTPAVVKIIGEKTGKWRLLAVSFLSLVGGVAALKAQGMDWGAALAHSSTLAAVQVFLHSLYKELMPQPAPAPALQAVKAKKKAKK
ncbi:hypothetical protein EBR03_05745 [bacterium]|nr:hypothetical protein [bacterium]